MSFPVSPAPLSASCLLGLLLLLLALRALGPAPLRTSPGISPSAIWPCRKLAVLRAAFCPFGRLLLFHRIGFIGYCYSVPRHDGCPMNCERASLKFWLLRSS